jgi:hypothetical protein
VKHRAAGLTDGSSANVAVWNFKFGADVMAKNSLNIEVRK